MIKLSIDERKLQKALRDINKYSKDVQNGITKQIAASTLTIESQAKELAPVGTPESTGIKGYHGGRLRSSINSDLSKPNIGIVGTNVEYSPFVELGTYKMSAKPFLYPAWNAQRQKFLNALRSLLKKS